MNLPFSFRPLTQRDVQHFVAAFGTALLGLVMETNQPLSKAVWLAAIPAAASVAYRQLFPAAPPTP